MELRVRLSKAFADFEEAPIAAASLGQVHRAALRDGRRVAVKVQRPGVREQVLQDLETLGDVVAADREQGWMGAQVTGKLGGRHLHVLQRDSFFAERNLEAQIVRRIVVIAPFVDTHLLAGHHDIRRRTDSNVRWASQRWKTKSSNRQ